VGVCPLQSADWPFDEGDARISFTSCYDYRKHPKTGVCHLHTGIDIGTGEHNFPPVYSLSNGTVITVVNTFLLDDDAPNSYGNYAIILDENNVQHLYGHLLEVNVTVGATVQVGQLIGLVDNTGTSTGNHLHYEVRTKKENGAYSSTNPCCGYIDCNKVGGAQCSCKEPVKTCN
jgi:murein DD-endopeptidase MepM/ murein hydrolase activator NlpD